jgi:hypothetical protein
MSKYKVTTTYTKVIEVEADSEDQATTKAKEKFIIEAPIVDDIVTIIFGAQGEPTTESTERKVPLPVKKPKEQLETIIGGNVTPKKNDGILTTVNTFTNLNIHRKENPEEMN